MFRLPFEPCRIRTLVWFQLLRDKSEKEGPANSAVVVVAPGTTDQTSKLNEIVSKLKRAKIRVASVDYPHRVRPKTLDWIAHETGGVAFTITESKYNMANSYISTYFKLTNVFYAVQQKFYQGSKMNLPIEVCTRSPLSLLHCHRLNCVPRLTISRPVCRSTEKK